jgi:hypothetical protein
MTLKKRFNRVEDERDQLRALFDILCTQPDAEAVELFRRLRTSQNPLSVLQVVRQAQLLLPELGPTSQTASNPEVEELDRVTLRRSAFKLRAYPWTTGAGDGIVSSLISSFFAWDGSYLISFVDQEIFIRDMSKGDIINATFCSPSLVNAICALQSVSPYPFHYLTITHPSPVLFGQSQGDEYNCEREPVRKILLGSQASSPSRD